MNLVNGILSKFGFTLFRTSFHKAKYSPKNEFSPLEQLFHKYYHKDFIYLQVGGSIDTNYDPFMHLLRKNNTKGILLEPGPECFENIKSQHNISELDLLIIHTDRSPNDIINFLDLELIKPRIITFEHGYKDKIMDKDDLGNAIQKLMNADYKIFIQSYDVIAYL